MKALITAFALLSFLAAVSIPAAVPAQAQAQTQTNHAKTVHKAKKSGHKKQAAKKRTHRKAASKSKKKPGVVKKAG